MPNSSRFPLKIRFLLFAASLLGPLVIMLIGKWTRYTVQNREYFDRTEAAGKGVIITLWHGRMLLPVFHHRNTGAVSLVSLHRDGEFITRIVERLGFVIRRGSPKEGGREGFQAVLTDLKQGKVTAMFPDGPTGPRHSIHDGVLHLARLTGAPILPMCFSAHPCWRAHSWDRFMIPKPYSRAIIRYGEPIYVPRRLGGAEELDGWRERIQATMIALEQYLDQDLGVKDE